MVVMMMIEEVLRLCDVCGRSVCCVGEEAAEDGRKLEPTTKGG